MIALSRILRYTDDGGLIFWCPGCNSAHRVMVGYGEGPRWSYNGDPDKPTFNPSIRVTYNGSDADKPDRIPSCCHSFVTDGRIEFCSDSTHSLAGQTVEIPPWDEHL
ncbi:MAG: ammonia monooxygenase [Sphingomonadales bacterium]|nr:MAG: ammonia monooxygenase [Sphingomonadales bacterium]